MKFLTTLIFSFGIAMLSTGAFGQNSGYLGHKYQFEIGTDLNLIQPSMGVGKMRLPNISAARNISRLRTVRLKFGMPKYELDSRVFSSFNLNDIQSESFYMPINSTNLELTYEVYAAIAPLKRFMRYGIGVDFLSYDTREFKFNTALSRLEEERAAVFYLKLGIGNNKFISDNVYINMGLDLNFSFLRRATDFLYYTDSNYYRSLQNQLEDEGKPRFSNSFDTKREYYMQKLVEFQLGIGVNL